MTEAERNPTAILLDKAKVWFTLTPLVICLSYILQDEVVEPWFVLNRNKKYLVLFKRYFIHYEIIYKKVIRHIDKKLRIRMVKYKKTIRGAV